MIKSSVYINTAKMQKLEEFSADKGLDFDDVVALLLRKILSAGNLYAKKFVAVKYQAADPDKNWKTATVYFEDVDYEFFTDMRKFFKESVSLLLSQAIDLFLDTILSEVKEILLNYANSDWDIRRDDVEMGVIWTIFWKNPGKNTTWSNSPPWTNTTHYSSLWRTIALGSNLSKIYFLLTQRCSILVKDQILLLHTQPLSTVCHVCRQAGDRQATITQWNGLTVFINKHIKTPK